MSTIAQLKRRRVLAMAAATLLVPVAGRASGMLARETLAQGQAVVYFRHGATTWSGVDQLEWPREQQRLLSDLGIQQSEQIGAAFRQRGWPVGDVLTSPFARCRDMAEIAFGRVEERMELVGLLSDRSGRAARITYLREQISKPTGGLNRIIISHRSNIAQVAGIPLDEGDGAVLRPSQSGFETLAVLRPSDW